MSVRDEPLGGDKMNYNNSKSTSESTVQNSQKTSFNANDTPNDMNWDTEQQEILQQCHEEKIASQMYHSITSHGFACNCVECN